MVIRISIRKKVLPIQGGEENVCDILISFLSYQEGKEICPITSRPQ